MFEALVISLLTFLACHASQETSTFAVTIVCPASCKHLEKGQILSYNEAQKVMFEDVLTQLDSEPAEKLSHLISFFKNPKLINYILNLLNYSEIPIATETPLPELHASTFDKLNEFGKAKYQAGQQSNGTSSVSQSPSFIRKYSKPLFWCVIGAALPYLIQLQKTCTARLFNH